MVDKSKDSKGLYGDVYGGAPRQRYSVRKPFWVALISVTLLLQLLYHNNPLHHVLMSTFSSRPINNTKLHFTLPQSQIDGPTGLFKDAADVWHIYYQHSQDASCRSWNHATSLDLYTWERQSTAIKCDKHDILGGSTVSDQDNTSGLFPNQQDGVIALYTQRDRIKNTQGQSIAYSRDGGYTFTKYSNLVLPASGRHSPKVSWHQQTRKWIMSIANVVTIEIYTSSNLLEWSIVSTFKNPLLGSGHSLEHPNLVLIPRIETTGATVPNYPEIPGGEVRDFGDYILLVSSPQGSPFNGGSITRYFPGTFNGTHFEAIDDRIDRYIDFGPDNYASQFFYGLPNAAPVVSLGRASSLQAHGLSLSSILTGPRESYLIHAAAPHGADEGDLSYFSRPAHLESLIDRTIANITVQKTIDRTIHFKSSDAILLDFKFVMQPDNDEIVELNIDFAFKASSTNEQIVCSLIFNTWTADLVCDRSLATLNRPTGNPALNQMAAQQVRPLLPFHNPAVRRWKVQAILDSSILEIYLNQGVKAGTMTMVPSRPFDTVQLKARNIPDWVDLDIKLQSLNADQKR